MPKYFMPLVAAMLLCSACCSHRKPCANRYCPPNAPTRPVCPPAKAATPCGCKKKARPTRCRQQAMLPTPVQSGVTLSEVLDYLPGMPPGYWSI